MLPYLNPKHIASVIIAKTQPQGGLKMAHREDEQDPGLMMASEELISAVHMKDATRVAKALKAAFMTCDSNEDDENDDDGQQE